MSYADITSYLECWKVGVGEEVVEEPQVGQDNYVLPPTGCPVALITPSRLEKGFILFPMIPPTSARGPQAVANGYNSFISILGIYQQ